MTQSRAGQPLAEEHRRTGSLSLKAEELQGHLFLSLDFYRWSGTFVASDSPSRGSHLGIWGQLHIKERK